MEATDDPELRTYLATIPVKFLDGMPICDGKLRPEDEIFGCYDAAANSIEVATVSWSRRPPWLYESQIQTALVHEYGHAIQYKQAGSTWHPVSGK